MKKIFFLATVSLFLIISAKAQTERISNKKPSNSEWLLFEQDYYSINYPSSWDLDDSGQYGSNFFLFSRQDSKEDKFRENVNLLIQDLSQYDLNIDQYVAVSLEQVSSVLGGVMLLSERVQNQEQIYHKMIYTATQENIAMKFEQYYWVTEENAYVLTLTCEESKFDNYQEIGERILNSFILNID